MNGRKRSRFANKRVTRTFQLAPTTRAIRAVLFGSAAMLALAGSGVAYAGTCANSAPNSIACNGDFAASVPSLYDPVIDLTLVLGDIAPTSVIPAVGEAGVNISSQANVGVVTHADISTVGADGVHIDGATSASLNNDGSISTDVTLGGVSPIDISAIGDVTIVNGGALHAFSTGDYLSATAVTATATSDFGNVAFDNLADGAITADTAGYSSVATGVSITTFGGAAVVNNEGDIAATATSNSGLVAGAYYFSQDYSKATGILIHSGGDATVVNTGSISASSQTESIQAGWTAGVAAYSFNGAGAVTVTNADTGTISATASLNAFGVVAVGGSNYFDLGTTGTVNNAGSISAEATGLGTFTGYSAFSSSLAVGVFAAHTSNAGDITATAHGDFGLTRGIWGSQSVDNSGTIFVDSSDGRGGSAQGIFLQANNIGDASISNSGSIIASGSGASTGVQAVVISGDLAVDNSGTIANIAVPGVNIFNALGINAQAYEGSVAVVNSGDIALDCGNKCYGLYLAVSGGNIVGDNSGAITLTGRYYEQGIKAIGIGGAVTLTNSGSISVDSSAGVSGVGGVRVINVDRITYAGDNISLDDQTTTITNTGSISAVINAPAGAEYLPLLGQIARAVSVYSQSGAIVISNSGSMTAESYSYSAFAGGAVGISASSRSGDITILNSGSILANSETSSVYKGGVAAGIYSFGDLGNVDITSSGTISAISISDYASDDGQTQALGVMGVSTHGDVTINNSSTGVITADASTLVYNTAAAYGVYARTTAGNLDVTNDGSISAAATSQSIAYLSSYGQTTAVGMDAVNLFGDSTTLSNSGTVSAVASTTALGAAHAFGISVYASSPYATAAITNTGTVTASAHADGHTDADDAATATGLSLINRYGGTSSIVNSGTIAADASSYLSSRANGVSIDASTLAFSSSGNISATATADATAGTALATGLIATGGTLGIDLGVDSTLIAMASAYEGTAIGLLVAGDIVTASNAGTINAAFTGGTAGNAYGAILVGNGAMIFTNSGLITAAGTDQSVGVLMSSDQSTMLINSGTITATTATGGGIAVLTGDSTDTIQNTGAINGAIVTGAGDDAITNTGTLAGQLFTGDGNDTLDNGVDGLWHAVGSSEFGAGDDTITNAGTLFLDGASITLGSSNTGNVFTNTGLIAVSGDTAIDLGAQNPFAFANTGIIDFRDGAPDDILTITGDFAGSGALGVDVSGLNGSGDHLYINGNVAADSVTTINANILDVPTAAYGSVGVVSVTGDSTAGSFVLGDVTFDTTQSFLTVDVVSLQSAIDTSNAVTDVFSVDFAVTGLTDAGTLAAGFSPGVQSLMNSQVGTWRQRMGVIDKTSLGPSVWGRAFADNGTVNPEHVAGNFGQGGNFSFDQRNSGQEVGVDYGFSDQFSVGLLLGKAHATQRLSDGGIGSTKLDGNTSGVYGTWISPSGFYLDVSYRHMGFDAKLNSIAGETRTHGTANAFNLEAGYAWTLGNGFKIEPQLQYTRTTVGDVDTLSGALTGFTPDGGTSSRGRLGVAVRKSFDAGGRVWTPYGAISAVRESDGENAYSINGNFFGTTSTKGTSALVEGGLNVQTGNLSVFGGVSWQDGGALDSVVGGQVGVRYSW